MRSRVIPLILCLFFFATSLQWVDAHGLAPALQDYPADTPVARVDGRILTVGELTTLLGMRSARYRPGTSLTYGVEDLMMQARHVPVYERLAEEGRQAGLEVSESMLEEVELETRGFARRELYRLHVNSRLQPPTIDQLRELYEQVKDTDLATPERFLIRRVQIPFADETEAIEALSRLDEIRSAYEQGSDIMAILRSAGINAPTTVFYPDREPDATLVESLREVGNDEALPIRSTEMAKELVIRHLHIPAGSIPFESSIGYLHGIILQRQASALSKEYLQSIADDVMVQVVEENLASVGELALDTDVILIVGDQPVTREQLGWALGWDLEVLSADEPDAFMNRAISSGIVQQHLLDAAIDREDFMSGKAVQEYRRNLADTLLVRAWLADSVDRRLAEVTDDEALLRWRMNEASLGRFHGRLRFDRLSLLAGEKDASPVLARLRGAESAAQFHETAQQAMRERIAQTLMSGLQDQVSNMPGELADYVKTATFPTAFVSSRDERGMVMAYWITEYVADREPSRASLEQARREVHEERWQDVFEAMLTEQSEDVRVEPLLRGGY